MTRITSTRTRPQRLKLECLERRDVPSFIGVHTILSGPTPSAVYIADLNNDAQNDILVSNKSTPGTISLMRNAGGGVFQAPKSFPSGGNNPTSLAVADFNGNGNLDAVVLNSGDSPVSLATADFNGDGVPDLVAGDYPIGLRVLIGNGDGTFQLPVTTVLATETLGSIEVGEFNADGYTDVVVLDGQNDLFRILLGLGDGTFHPPLTHATDNSPTAITTADFDGDSDIDLAVTSYSNEMVSVFLGEGDGTFQTGASYSISPYNYGRESGDFNNDSHIDLAIGGGKAFPKLTATIFLGNGDGTFVERAPFYSGGSESVVTGDFDRDGNLDLVTQGKGFYLLLGNGDGSFGGPVNYFSPGTPRDESVGDFDGDGYTDLALMLGFGILSVYRGHASGTQQSPLSFNFSANSTFVISIGDYNQDGRPDLTGTHPGNPGDDRGSIGLMLNDGAWPAPLPIGDGPRPSALLGGEDATHDVGPTSERRVISNGAPIEPTVGDESPTAPRPKYTPRTIVRVALFQATALRGVELDFNPSTFILKGVFQ